MKFSMRGLIFAVLLGMGIVSAQAETFRLTPDKTLSAVRDEVRAWRAADAARVEESVEVIVEPGTWVLTEPVTFGPEDSFTHYKAAEPGNSIFTRGKKIENVQLDERGYFTAKIPTDTENWRFESLFVDGRRAQIAQEPDEFYAYIRSVVPFMEMPDGSKVDTVQKAFMPRPEEEPLFEKLAAGGTISDVMIQFFFSWESEISRLNSYTPEEKRVLLQNPTIWALDYWGGNLRYRLMNFAEGLDEPGEWFLDREGNLTYIPLPGQTPENTALYAPIGGTAPSETGFLRIAGDVEKAFAEAGTKEGWVRDLTFDSLTFSVDEYSLPAGGIRSAQAAVNSPISIIVDAGKGVRLTNLTIEHIGGYAVWFRNGCRDCSLESSLLEDLGAGGVKVGGKPVVQHVTVRDTVIRNYGNHDAGAVGLWAANAQECDLVHNDISDGFYTGVSIGWVWGYAESATHHNRVEFNRIHHIGKGVLSDMGGVYSLGISPGTRVANNVIHDVYSYNRFGRGGWGLYTDEGSSDMLFENNLVYRVHTGMIHQHYGQNNTFRNNILAYSLDGQIQRSRVEDHTSFTLENNIILWDKSPLFSGNWKDGHYVLRNNLYCYTGPRDQDGEKNEQFFDMNTLSQWQEMGRDEGSILADPEFTDPANGDFTFKNGEPNEAVKQIGFVPFDYSLAGVESERMKKIADDYVYPELRLAPNPPAPVPLEINETFDSPRRSLIPKAELSIEGKKEAAQIIEEEGNSFFRFTDGDSFKARYNPHFFYHPGYKTGTAQLAFDLRWSGNIEWMAEARTMTQPYCIGPHLSYQAGALSCAGNKISLSEGVWYRFRIDTPLNSDKAEISALQIDRLEQGQPVETLYQGELSPVSSGFRTLDWFGIFTPGIAGILDVDNITLKSQAVEE